MVTVEESDSAEGDPGGPFVTNNCCNGGWLDSFKNDSFFLFPLFDNVDNILWKLLFICDIIGWDCLLVSDDKLFIMLLLNGIVDDNLYDIKLFNYFFT